VCYHRVGEIVLVGGISDNKKIEKPLLAEKPRLAKTPKHQNKLDLGSDLRGPGDSDDSGDQQAGDSAGGHRVLRVCETARLRAEKIISTSALVIPQLLAMNESSHDNLVTCLLILSFLIVKKLLHLALLNFWVFKGERAATLGNTNVGLYSTWNTHSQVDEAEVSSMPDRHKL
jgi:hypothetical protein